jgi:hypothetical protein
MTKKRKRWSEMTTDELAEATQKFDDPNYDPPAIRPTARQLVQLRNLQRKAFGRRYRIALCLEKKLVEQTDNYAVNHGVTFSDVVANALRQLMRKKSA